MTCLVYSLCSLLFLVSMMRVERTIPYLQFFSIGPRFVHGESIRLAEKARSVSQLINGVDGGLDSKFYALLEIGPQ